jgi:hypothetical protein
MDEACLTVGQVTDDLLLEEMDRKLKGHNHYSSRRYTTSTPPAGKRPLSFPKVYNHYSSRR